MTTTEEQLEEPFIRAGAVPGDKDGKESIHVFIAWHTVGEVALRLMSMMPSVMQAAAELQTFDGEIRFVFADEFLPETPKNLKDVLGLEKQLQLLAADQQSIRIRCVIGDD